VLLNYHIGRFVLGSLCVGDLRFGVAGFEWCPCSKREQNYRCGNSTAQSQAPDYVYINVRNMLST